jgi:hypothetical protein
VSQVTPPDESIEMVQYSISTASGKSCPTLLALPDSKLFSKIASLITGEEHVAFLHTLSIPTIIELGILEERLEKVSGNEENDEEKPKSLVYR